MNKIIVTLILVIALGNPGMIAFYKTSGIDRGSSLDNRLAFENATLKGYVLTPEGVPVSPINIYTENLSFGYFNDTQNDGTGYYEMNLSTDGNPSAVFQISLDYDYPLIGWRSVASLTHLVVDEQDNWLNITLTVLRGYVLKPDGNPLNPLEISALNETYWEEGHIAVEPTGYFELYPPVRDGSSADYSVSVSYEYPLLGWRNICHILTTVDEFQDNWLNITLTVLRGYVLKPDGSPLNPLELSALNETYWDEGYVAVEPTGYYELYLSIHDGVIADYVISVIYDNPYMGWSDVAYGETAVAISEDNWYNLTLAVLRGYILKPDGTPIGQLELFIENTTFGDEGYSLTDPVTGYYEIYIVVRDGAYAEYELQIWDDASSNIIGFVQTTVIESQDNWLNITATVLCGFILRPDGTPISPLYIEVENSTYGDDGDTDVDPATGYYELYLIIREGGGADYDFIVWHQSPLIGWQTIYDISTFANESKFNWFNVTLTVLKGYVLKPDGNPWLPMKVSAENTTYLHNCEADVNATGYYEIYLPVMDGDSADYNIDVTHLYSVVGWQQVYGGQVSISKSEDNWLNVSLGIFLIRGFILNETGVPLSPMTFTAENTTLADVGCVYVDPTGYYELYLPASGEIIVDYIITVDFEYPFIGWQNLYLNQTTVNTSHDNWLNITVSLSPIYNAHPVRINSNADFDATHGVTNTASGDGSAGNPWIIENWVIDGTGYGYCIYIGNTTDHFIINNCTLTNASGNSGTYYYNSAIHLRYTDNGNISDNSLINSYRGIYDRSSDYVQFYNNRIENNTIGLDLYGSYWNTVTQNVFYKNDYGITTYMDRYCDIFQNNFTESIRDGMNLWYSRDNDYHHNLFENNGRNSVMMRQCTNLNFMDNQFFDYGFFIEGYYLEDYNSHIIDSSNTLGGKPIAYIRNLSGATPPANAGQYIIVNCSDMTLNGQTISEMVIVARCDNITVENNHIQPCVNHTGIWVTESTNTSVRFNVVSGCLWDQYPEYGAYGVGIYIDNSNNNQINNNNVSECYYGISLLNSDIDDVSYNSVSLTYYTGIQAHGSSSGDPLVECTIHDNDIVSNYNHGVTITGFHNSTYFKENLVKDNAQRGINMNTGTIDPTHRVFIENNYIDDNQYGLYEISDGNNIILGNTFINNGYSGVLTAFCENDIYYHNNFINNGVSGTRHVQDQNNGMNIYDNGYPSGGNYWGGSTFNDIYSGPNQDIPGSDDIGDTPYTNFFIGTNIDHYPLMAPWTEPVIPDYTMQLAPGWNLVSLPLDLQDTAITEVLSSIAGLYTVVKYFDSTDAADPWKTYRPGGTANDLFFIDHRMGFWINMLDYANLTVLGDVPGPTQITLYAGWNLVGYPSLNETTNVGNALWGTGADRVETFDLGSPFLISEVGPTYIMKPGKGYWIHVPSDTVWTVNW